MQGPPHGRRSCDRSTLRYDVCMKKRRVTLNLDEDVVEALEAVGGRSMSSVANDALREALEVAAHRAALREWLDELDEKHGAPSPEELAAAKDLLDAVKQGAIDGSSAA
ncbi:MAG: BrnA antitoxin family protein [Pseudonocardiaceae bacterium]